jgi:hypothetical protein
MGRRISKEVERGLLLENFLHPPNLPCFEPHLDAVRMGGRAGQDVAHLPLGAFAGSLIGLLHYRDPCSWGYS